MCKETTTVLWRSAKRSLEGSAAGWGGEAEEGERQFWPVAARRELSSSGSTASLSRLRNRGGRRRRAEEKQRSAIAGGREELEDDQRHS
jgi:hypothetical protein